MILNRIYAIHILDLLNGKQYLFSSNSLVTLGDRVFAIGGHRFGIILKISPGEVIKERPKPEMVNVSEVEELHFLSNNSWTVVADSKLSSGNSFLSTLGVPADMFAHLPGGCEGVQ
jgi:hypothetical protein